METEFHARLKRLAIAFLRASGCQIVAPEVACPLCRFRVDVAAYWDTLNESGNGSLAAEGTLWSTTAGKSGSAPFRRIEPRTVMIECKQSRADFLRDRQDRDSLLTMRDRLLEKRERFEQDHIKRFEPHLRQSGSALFSELEDWDYASSRLGDYRKLMAQLSRLDRQIYGETKFCLISRYRLADRLYLLAPKGMIRPRELPDGWGLLEYPAAMLHDDAIPDAQTLLQSMRMKVPAPVVHSREDRRARLLRNIAAAASRSVHAEDRQSLLRNAREHSPPQQECQ